MAIPKPIRFMAGATMVLFLFLGFQIMRNPRYVLAPGSGAGKMANMDRDPNLDGTQQHAARVAMCSR